MVQRFDPVTKLDQGCKVAGDMECCDDGDYVKIEDHEKAIKDLKTEILAFLENVLTGGWHYVELGDMSTDATNLKNRLAE